MYVGGTHVSTILPLTQVTRPVSWTGMDWLQSICDRMKVWSTRASSLVTSPVNHSRLPLLVNLTVAPGQVCCNAWSTPLPCREVSLATRTTVRHTKIFSISPYNRFVALAAVLILRCYGEWQAFPVTFRLESDSRRSRG